MEKQTPCGPYFRLRLYERHQDDNLRPTNRRPRSPATAMRTHQGHEIKAIRTGYKTNHDWVNRREVEIAKNISLGRIWISDDYEVEAHQVAYSFLLNHTHPEALLLFYADLEQS